MSAAVQGEAAFYKVSSRDIDGLSNFRDFGGHLTQPGRCIARGRLYRSANLAALSAPGLQQMTSLGIGRVVDLRGVTERLSAMPRIAEGVIDIRSAPVEPRISATLRQLLVSGTATRDQLRDLMIASYRAYVTEAAQTFGDAIEAVVTAHDGAVLVHCTAGKDRTGFLVALLQRALGAADDVVLADYLRTNTDWNRASVIGHLPLDAEAVEAVLVADTDYLAAAFEEIERLDGSLAAFIHRATQGRVTQDQLIHLLEPEA